MIKRVATDVWIADGELKRANDPMRVALSSTAYAGATRHRVVPCFGNGLQKSMEGYLFPSTYFFDTITTGDNLAQAQVMAFCGEWRTLDLSYAKSKGLRPYDVLRIASLVEAEAAVPGDRAKIAAVIYNRLRLKMPLGIDASLRYGLHIPADQSITDAELQSSSPYNTRKFLGLPPTPIANPGLPSLEAAAHPSTLGYLYYVRIPGTDPGRHQFFESFSAYEEYLSSHGYGPHP
jgi:UPF0755 protein